MAIPVKSIQQFLIERGHHPDEVVNGESLKDLLWAFWVEEQDYRHDKAKEDAAEAQ